MGGCKFNLDADKSYWFEGWSIEIKGVKGEGPAPVPPIGNVMPDYSVKGDGDYPPS